MKTVIFRSKSSVLIPLLIDFLYMMCIQKARCKTVNLLNAASQAKEKGYHNNVDIPFCVNKFCFDTRKGSETLS